MSLRKLLNGLLRPLGYELARTRDNPEYPADFSKSEIEIIDSVRRYTMAKSVDKIFPIVNAARHVVEQRVPGSIVECGVWRGGMMMAAARTLLTLADCSRHLYLFDTFAGMAQPSEQDIDAKGKRALTRYREAQRTATGEIDWCYASVEEVARNMKSTGYPMDKVHLVKGLVETTLPAEAPELISILRLDTDWYASSKHELLQLFPRLQTGGVLILDDYGFWQGCRQATDEYFEEHHVPMHLIRIDETCRVGIKLPAVAKSVP